MCSYIVCSTYIVCVQYEKYTHTPVHMHTHTRRAPGSKFVPPVRRDEREGEAGEGESSVRSRVLYGGPSGSGGGRGLPPELEGDERLKNIEPRMVELIMNEVCREKGSG